MCGITARCVGVSTVPVREQGTVTGLVGVHGKVSGFCTVNMTERVALRAVGGLLQEEFKELNSQVVDGAGEIANLVVGGIKSAAGEQQVGLHADHGAVGDRRQAATRSPTPAVWNS